MSTFAPRSSLSSAARITFVGALLLFIATIVIGILNGLDIYEPDHDTLMTHVHAGTLGWLTLAVSGIALLIFSQDRQVSADETRRARSLAWAMTGAIALYVAAFFAGDRIPGDRIQRPIVGTLLFIVVVWFLVWLVQTNRSYGGRSVARLGVILSWISLLIGAVFGVVLGIFSARGEVPGLSDDTAKAVAEAHPPAMVIGFLILASMAIIEWLVHRDRGWTRSGAIQMWLVFAAGVIVNVAFLSGLEEELLGPANLLMIVGVVMLVVRSWSAITPAAWRGAGTGVFPKLSILFLLVYLVLLTVVVAQFISGAMDIDALTDSQLGLLLTFDHVMFIGVMTNAIFGVLAVSLVSVGARAADRILLWGVNVGIIGFGLGLITVTAALKRVFAPIMGIALLIGIAAYLKELNTGRTEQPATEHPVSSYDPSPLTEEEDKGESPRW